MPRLRRIWADGAYRGRLVRCVRRTRRWVLQIISRPAGSRGFVLLKWRWIVERTFGWLNLSRRLSKDYEVLPARSEAFIRLAMLSIMLRRLARQWISHTASQDLLDRAAHLLGHLLRCAAVLAFAPMVDALGHVRVYMSWQVGDSLCSPLACELSKGEHLRDPPQHGASAVALFG
jgi:transposase